MKLLRYGLPGQEEPGVLASDGSIRDLSNLIPDLAGPALLPGSLDKLRQADISGLPRVAGKPRIGPCVGGVGKFVCIGLNYSDHAAESGMAVPAEPVVFMKATSSICGPDDDVVIPRGAKKADWEVELGVVIGKPAKYVGQAMPCPTSRDIAWSMIFQNAPSSSKAPASGSKARAPTLSAHWAVAGHARRSSRPAESGSMAGG